MNENNKANSTAVSSSDKRETWITRLCIAITVGVLMGVLHFFAEEAHQAFRPHQVRLSCELILFGGSVLFLIYGNLLYQFCRLGYYYRRQRHKPCSTETLYERFYAGDTPSLTVLVPSYKEEPSIIWQTMVSAALTEYPDKSVVLLIDDPYQPSSPEELMKLEQARNIAVTLQDRFRVAAERHQAELMGFLQRTNLNPAAELERLAESYRAVSRWLEELAAEFETRPRNAPLTHEETFFLEKVLRASARHHAALADEFQQKSLLDEPTDRKLLECHFRRLASVFDVHFSSFERKKYRNLSHDANKAMNLNSYIGLLGKAWKEVQVAGDWYVSEASDETADFVVPNADYLITLDADSLLLSDYALRLVSIMEDPNNRNVAVIQTPYSAFPGSPNVLERVAGATTDLQYIAHQGFTHWDATFWVGANALVRRAALDDIKQVRVENGFPTAIYIQDRTVIEDTESSIDLINKGWKLVNYPERLAYSATPPDFGALLIQRRRWANGGLLIVPKLLEYAARTPKRPPLFKELFMRLHYLTSLAGVSTAMLLVFFYPFRDSFAILWLPLTAVPYYILYARDLRINGYRYSDVLRVYALNLMLIPVVLGGVLKSIHQGATGSKTPFGRTPKIVGRTAAPALYCFVELSLPVFFLLTFGWDMSAHRWSHAVFSLFNGAFFFYAVFQMLGLREAASDLICAVRLSKPEAELETT